MTLAELLFGIGSLPTGKRKTALTELLHGLLALFKGRVLAFDMEAAQHYAVLALRARTSGKGLPVPDGYIAAIAKARNFAVATRDVAPFEAAGVDVVNPWMTPH